jgi:hypothetical protein
MQRFNALCKSVFAKQPSGLFRKAAGMFLHHPSGGAILSRRAEKTIHIKI